MTKSRKMLGLILLVCFALTAVIAVGVLNVGTYRVVAAELSGIDNYFGAQLNTAEQKEMYKAMQEMLNNEVFIKGEDYDLVASGHVTQAQLEAYANGDMTLLNAMGAARDAFYTDYDDIFYVDFGYLSLRVTQGSDGYHAYLGTGRSDTYWTQGFTSEASVRAAIAEYESAFNKIVKIVKETKPNSKQVKSFGNELGTQIAKVREAHRQVAINTVYRLETAYEWEKNADNSDYSSHVRTTYGAFVKGKALCEGYARAFKAIMDEIGVPCVLVNGVYRHGNNQEELHMWTYVMLDGSWYAVDPTFDDLNFDDREKWPADKHPSIANHTTPLDESLLPDQFKEEVEEENSVYADEMGVYYNEDYFLKGASYMNTQHATSPYKSEVEYPFTYPDLAEHNIGYEMSLAHGGLFKVVQTPFDGTMDSTNVYVSVLIDGEWCGYAEAAEKGYYILVRYEGNYLPDKLKNHQDLSHIKDNEFLDEEHKLNSDSSTVWAYLNPIMKDGESMYDSIQEGDGYTVMQDTSKPTGLEFALTTRAPRTYEDVNDIDQIVEMTTFTGDLTMFVARSGFIPIKYGNPDYQPAPHIVKSTPTHMTKLLLSSFASERTYNITVEYDQVLKLIGDATELKMSVYGVRATGEILKGTHAIKLSEVVDLDSVTYDLGRKLEDGTYQGGSVSFTFTPYEAWAYDNVEYIFNFNLEGVYSHKQVNPATYAVGYECEALCYRAYGYHWNVFAQPRLMEEDDVSKDGWVTSDGTDVSQTKDRLALVVTRPSQKQEGEMMGMIGKEFEEDILESFTYNITLTICKSIVIETGMGVRVCVGFPEGFTYDSSLNGVTFKAYHFTRDKWDNVTGVEEIECTVTPLGLVLMCKSFSPFAIVAAKADPNEVSTDRKVIVSGNYGGAAYTETEMEVEDKETGETSTILAQSRMFSLKQGESRILKVEINNGFEIESFTLNGEKKTLNSDNTFELKYEDMTSANGSNFVEVSFISTKVKQAQEQRGESNVVVKQEAKEPVVTVIEQDKSVTMDAGGELRLAPNVESYGATSYRWYRNDKLLEDQTGTVLVIRNAQASDSGTYVLVVSSTSMLATSTYSVQSEPMKVTVNAKDDTPGTEEPGTEKPGTENQEQPDDGKDGLSSIVTIGLIVGACFVILVLIIVLLVPSIKKKDQNQ